jgi:hypothetical protein
MPNLLLYEVPSKQNQLKWEMACQIKPKLSFRILHRVLASHMATVFIPRLPIAE